MNVQDQDNIEPQPLLPRVGMVWFFITVLLVAVAMFVVRSAEQGQALSAAMVFTLVFLAATAIFWGCAFVVAFLLGALEKAVEGDQQRVGSPFIDGTLPDQIVPPKASEDI